jgi:hypothetical protein
MGKRDVEHDEGNDELFDARENVYKFVISVASLFSVTSLLTLCLVLPSVYSYVNNIGQYSRQDFVYCDVGHLSVNSVHD